MEDKIKTNDGSPAATREQIMGVMHALQRKLLELPRGPVEPYVELPRVFVIPLNKIRPQGIAPDGAAVIVHVEDAAAEAGRLTGITSDQVHLHVFAEQIPQVEDHSLDYLARPAFNQQDPWAVRDIGTEKMPQTAIVRRRLCVDSV